MCGDRKINNLTGYGILFIDGDFEAAGNLDWDGLILVSGDLTFSGGCSKMIYVAGVVQYEAQATNGSMDIINDFEVLDNFV